MLVDQANDAASAGNYFSMYCQGTDAEGLHAKTAIHSFVGPRVLTYTIGYNLTNYRKVRQILMIIMLPAATLSAEPLGCLQIVWLSRMGPTVLGKLMCFHDFCNEGRVLTRSRLHAVHLAVQGGTQILMPR